MAGEMNQLLRFLREAAPRDVEPRSIRIREVTPDVDRPDRVVVVVVFTRANQVETREIVLPREAVDAGHGPC